ncbi:MAG: hypothetical protein ACYTG5_09265 [Planctomycetota bacterium]
MRGLLQIVLFVAVLGALLVIAKGLTPIFPAAGAFIRFALNPIGIVLLLALFFLMRLGMMRRRLHAGNLESGADAKRDQP